MTLLLILVKCILLLGESRNSCSNILICVVLWQTGHCERCHNIRSSGIENSSERVSGKVEIFECFWCNAMNTQVRGYPSRYTKSTQKSQLFRIPSHLGIHPVTPKALKNLNFSGYPLTWVSISLHQKHSKISTFQDTLYKFVISTSLLSWRATCRYPTYGYYDIYAKIKRFLVFFTINIYYNVIFRRYWQK